MDDSTSSTSKTIETKERKRPDTAMSKDSKKEEKAGRARSRSIWGRSKKDKPAMPDTSTMPSLA